MSAISSWATAVTREENSDVGLDLARVQHQVSGAEPVLRNLTTSVCKVLSELHNQIQDVSNAANMRDQAATERMDRMEIGISEQKNDAAAHMSLLQQLMVKQEQMMEMMQKMQSKQ